MSFMSFDVFEQVNGSEYDFLRMDEHFGGNIVLLGVGGSYAYGTNVENSDLDLRGIALNSKRDILLSKDWGKYVNDNVDTTIYSIMHAITLLKEGNPFLLEMLGLDKSLYLVLSPVGKRLIDNQKLFFSKYTAKAYGGYVNRQKMFADEALAKNRSRGKIAKPMMHRVRVYYTAFDLLEQGKLKLYRDKEHDLLMSIRNGEYQNADNTPNADYEALINELEKRFVYAKEHTVLPDEADVNAINEMLFEINEQVVKTERKKYDF